MRSSTVRSTTSNLFSPSSALNPFFSCHLHGLRRNSPPAFHLLRPRHGSIANLFGVPASQAEVRDFIPPSCHSKDYLSFNLTIKL
ncbi:hypothetical protein FCM35_KLT19771 [Carex littledalei]|uniref:Uncharacterized protein n=1 Tax=Carex littledalei TaxID=544730 RepID=A0A833VVX8_9POAL|nr:hypothetical protein FCM35_KLT19771 [Carex littledalei]